MKRVLPVIVICQFFCTSVWFAGNAVLPEIIEHFHLAPSFLAQLTSAVQFGFISGTFLFAVFTISDRFSPSLIFFVSSIIAGLFNLAILIPGISSSTFLVSRFLTGFFLAGIYPVGMKIASDYYKEGLGKSLGFLVGALVLGTAFPHLIKSFTTGLPWRYVIFSTSALSGVGGLIILVTIPDGPFRKPSQQLNLTAFLKVFHNTKFRSAAFGYFGHMWELYTFWAFVPIMLMNYNRLYPTANLNIPLLSFIIIASGGVACAIGGLASKMFGVNRLALIALFCSCFCCIASPLMLFTSSVLGLIVFLIFWGMVVVADSPLFSTLVAQNAPEHSRGTSLTIVNCIGFSITIVSIQLINSVSANISTQYVYMLLAIGPILGLISLLKDHE
jgi:MFS family permease